MFNFMKWDIWIILTAIIFFIVGAVFDYSILNFLGWVTLIIEIGYILIKTV